MAKILIAGRTLVVESKYSLEELKFLSKWRPKSLTLFDNKEPVFAVGTTGGKGSVSQVGVSFGQASPTTGKAIVSITIPDDVTDVAEYAEETVGVAILNLNKVEAQIEDAIGEVAAEKVAIRDTIQVI